MKAMTYSESHAKFAEVLQTVVEDREEVIITRTGHDPAVIVSLEEYNSLLETVHLMRSPANAQRLTDAITRLKESAHNAGRAS